MYFEGFVMYCRNCGKKIDENFKVCPYCGTSYEQNFNMNYNVKQEVNSESNGICYGIIGFFFPIVGLILYLVWMNERPRAAKSAGIGALINVILGVIFAIIVLIFIFLVGVNSL